MYRKSGIGYILVITPSVYNADTGRKGVGGVPIMVDIAFDPMKYALNNAEAYQLPIDMGKNIIIQNYPGVPGYGPIRRPHALDTAPSSDLYAIGNVYKYKTVGDIVPEVQIGDKIYFKPRTLNNKRNYMGALKDPETKVTTKYIYKVPYENIFCTVREGVINMIGGWVLLDPIMEDWNDTVKET